MQRDYAAARCRLGGAVEYREYDGVDHVGIIGDGSPLIPDLLAWTQARFAGQPAPSDCPASTGPQSADP